MTDFELYNHGSLYIVVPLSQTAQEWVDHHISDDTPWFGGGFACEPRYIDDLVLGIQAAGLSIH